MRAQDETVDLLVAEQKHTMEVFSITAHPK
jgi:hypothetical protein